MYKIKHIVSLNRNLLLGKVEFLDIEGSVYSFKVEEVKSSVICLTEYFRHEDIRYKSGPVEKELMQITYGKSRSQMESWQLAKAFTYFNMDIFGKPYKLEIKGVGDTAVKLNLYLSFKEIDDADTVLCRHLKSEILDAYENEIIRNKLKLDELKMQDDIQEAEKQRIREELRKEDEANKEKFKDIAHLL